MLRAFAAWRASNNTAAGSPPGFVLITSVPVRSPQTSSCSIAAARNVSAAQSKTVFPSVRRMFASFPIVVVFPVPFTPTTRITSGSPSCTSTGGIFARVSTVRTSSFNSRLRSSTPLICFRSAFSFKRDSNCSVVLTTEQLLSRLKEKADRKQINGVDDLKRLLKEEVLTVLTRANIPPVEVQEGDPEVILVVGVNGTGKTTTIGKLANILRGNGKSVLLCAADTFRAAAIEQLEVWGDRTGTEVIKTKAGGDPAAALYDAMQAAKARHSDYLIVDTAGRLHTKTGLMAELDKMRRTAQKVIPTAPHETLLVMDATTGQNGLQQARLFTE